MIWLRTHRKNSSSGTPLFRDWLVSSIYFLCFTSCMLSFVSGPSYDLLMLDQQRFRRNARAAPNICSNTDSANRGTFPGHPRERGKFMARYDTARISTLSMKTAMQSPGCIRSLSLVQPSLPDLRSILQKTRAQDTWPACLTTLFLSLHPARVRRAVLGI